MNHLIRILFVTCVVLLFGCAPLTLGRPFGVDPALEIKAGHDLRKDVIGKMGQPFRRGVDSRGREIFTYVWADGVGGGSKCLIAFNKNGIVSLVEVTP